LTPVSYQRLAKNLRKRLFLEWPSAEPKRFRDRVTWCNRHQLQHSISHFRTTNTSNCGIKKDKNTPVTENSRIDARLRFLYQGEQSGIGRPKKYTEFVDVNDFEKLEFVEDIKSDDGKILKLYSAIVNAVSFKRDIRIAVIIDVNEKDKDKKAHAIFFSTDIHQSASDIVVCYKARYQIEFIIRDGKGFAGLNDCQARTKEKLNLHFNASLAALNLTKIVDRINQEKNTAKSSFSMASWKRRFYNEKLISSIFSMLGIDLTLIKLSSDFKNLVNYGVISRVT
jgi:hypothetical protein